MSKSYVLMFEFIINSNNSQKVVLEFSKFEDVTDFVDEHLHDDCFKVIDVYVNLGFGDLLNEQ